MSGTARPVVSLLSLQTDPLQQAGSMLRSLTPALVEQGWQVNLFSVSTAVTSLMSVPWLSHCQLVRLPIVALANVAAIAQTIQSTLTKSGLLWPLFHSFDEPSAKLGAYFKCHYGWRWIHTPNQSMDHPWRSNEQSLCSMDEGWVICPDQWLPWRSTALPPNRFGIDEVSQKRYQRQHSQVREVDTWAGVAGLLDRYYRQHLAAYLGAPDVDIPSVADLPIPCDWNTIHPVVAVSPYSYSA